VCVFVIHIYYLTVVVFGLQPKALFLPCYTRCYTPPSASALDPPAAEDGTYLCYTRTEACGLVS